MAKEEAVKCTECGLEFTPDTFEEEICPECQCEDVPEAHQDEDDWRYSPDEEWHDEAT